MAITKDQIFQAADQLTAAGESATMAAVRKLLGGGSYTTINEGLKEWKAKQHTTNTLIREPAPPAVATRLEELGADIWAVALELANTRLTTEREALEATRIQVETAQQEATELADQLSVELETLQSNCKQVVSDLQTANAALEQLRQENATLTRQLATTEARAEETTKRADDLKAELQHAHAENKAQRERHANETQALQDQLNTTEKALQTEVANGVRLTLELTHAQTQAQAAQQQQQALQERSATEIQRMNERLTQAQAEREQALQAARATREDAAGLRGELEALRVQNAALLGALKQTSH
ncbi:DNA-binding protein [Thiothrix winogradskyi]|uniref:DNA-binding protein n=1 Tax=Thiothrix winogradskyi TaxID=96472 RepID=A0ABY3SXS8_9GAMM|nr:DNA-binding protein [Thiothrix winogradskyi]UJS23525.1 DNA-binding protein [Thiothrix winogradskyi]